MCFPSLCLLHETLTPDPRPTHADIESNWKFLPLDDKGHLHRQATQIHTRTNIISLRLPNDTSHTQHTLITPTLVCSQRWAQIHENVFKKYLNTSKIQVFLQDQNKILCGKKKVSKYKYN